jgi:hypothetical protein
LGPRGRPLEEEYLLPSGYEDAPPAAALVVLYTEAGDGDWCLLKVHENNPLTLDEAAGGC